jgi:hypothetical protein
MAWVEGEAVKLEQGLDGLVTFELFANTALTQPWPFPSWDVNAVLSDEKQRTSYTLTTIVDALNGNIKVIIPEAIVNSLKTTKTWFLNVLMVAPGNTQADDHHLAYLPVTVAARPARRDP